MGYSKEFKTEILDAFFESKQSLRKFADDYGMSRNTLYLWAKGDPRYEAVHAKAPWRKYSPEFKYKAVQMVIVDGLSSHKTAEMMGCKHGPMVSTWVRAYKKKGMIGSGPPEQPTGKKRPETKKAKRSKTASLEEYARELETENERLEKEARKLKFGAGVAHATAEVRLKKGSGLDTTLLSNVEKTEIIDVLRPKHSLKGLPAYLELAPSSYEYCKQIQGRADKYACEREAIIEVSFDAKETYGYRRVAAGVAGDYEEVRVSERVARRIMREESLCARQTRKRSYSSYKGEVGKAAKNVLCGSFKATKPLEKIASDVTGFKVARQKTCLSHLIDLYAGEALSYSVGPRPAVEFVLDMFDEQTRGLLKESSCITHTDQGFQYQHIAYRSLLEELGCTQSMSRKGNCLDNAPAESFFGHLKTEFYYGRKFKTVEQFIEDLDEYIWWYNNKRIKMRLDGQSPVQYRQAYEARAA